jgi:alkylation response protein AidB-like acyl-CoA dehydrogenase
MSVGDPELRQFLEAVRKLVADHTDSGRLAGAAADAGKLRAALDGADVTDLALETHGMDTAGRWLSEVVREVARECPSLGFVLAARYTAQWAIAELGGADGGREATTAFLDPLPGVPVEDEETAGVAPFLFEPDSVLVLNSSSSDATLIRQGAFEDLGDAPARSGLADAKLRLVRVSDSATPIDRTIASGLLRDWHILAGSVSIGIAESALSAAESYAGERSQFGAKLTSFVGIRAMLAEMHIRLTGARAILDQQIGAERGMAASAMAAAVAGRAAVDIALDAVQVHGGYGYIDEYPVARLVRDAVSMRARSGSRRAAVARIAEHRLGAFA